METMRVVSVNVGRSENLEFGARHFVTGILKRPAAARVRVGRAGLANDVICDVAHHGGADQAVYVYASGDYDWWSERLGRRIEPGTFGDNLTIDGLPPDLHAGDRLLIGDVILEATAPRIPCSTLAARMGDSNFGLEFRRAERPGYYFRVLNAGEIGAGDAATLVETPEDSVTMLDLFRLAYEPQPDANAVERALASPIAERTRANLEEKLRVAG